MFIVKPNELAAVALAASTEETRYYLGGVFFEKYKDGETGMTATDGHRMHAIGVEASSVAIESFIFKTEDINQALLMAKHAAKIHGRLLKHLVRILISKKGPKLQVMVGIFDGEDATQLSIETGRFECMEIDGTYPDWRRVVPRFTGVSACTSVGFNANYLVDFQKASKLLSAERNYRGLRIEFESPDGPAQIHLTNERFLGVLMPMRM